MAIETFTLPVCCYNCGTLLDDGNVSERSTIESQLVRKVDTAQPSQTHDSVKVRHVRTLICLTCKEYSLDSNIEGK